MTEQRMTDTAQDIPRRGQADSEEALVALINGHPESLWLMDADGTVIAANETVARRLGTSVSELVGSCVYDFLSPDVANRRKACVNDVIRTGKPAGLEDMRTGRHLNSHIHPIFNAEGKVTRLAVTSIDVTERVRAEQALQHLLDIEELVSNISTHFINVAAEELDAEIRHALQAIGQFIEVERGYLGLLSGGGMKIESEYEWCDEGVEPQSSAIEGMSMAPYRWLMGQVDLTKVVSVSRVADLPPEASFEKGLWQARGVQSVLTIPLFQGETLVGYLGFQSLKGEKRWAEEDSRLLRIVGEVFLNVLARRRAEEELQHAHDQLEGRVEERTAELAGANIRLRQEIAQRGQVEETLRQSEERLRSLFETMAEGVVVIATDGQILQANPAAERILGLKRSKIEGRHYMAPERQVLRPDGTEMPPEEMAGPRAMKKKRPVKDSLMGVKRADGTVSWINAGAAPLLNPVGDLEGVVGTFADITEHKRAEDAMRHRLVAEELVATISTGFINVPPGEMDSKIIRALQTLGEFTGDDRCYLSLLDSDVTRIEHVYEWCSEGMDPLAEKIEGLPMAPFRWAMGILERHDSFHVRRLADLPPEASAEKKRWAKLGIRSLLAIPLYHDEVPVAVLGFHSYRVEKEWPGEDIRLLKLAGQMFLSMLVRNRAEVALRQSEERYRRLVELSPNLIGVAVDQKIAFVNTAGAELLAAESPEQLIGRPITDIVHPDYRQRAGQRIQQMMEEGIGVPLVEEKWLRLDGATIYVAVAAVPFPHQGAYAIQVVAYDITDRKRVESQRDASLEALRESEEKYRLVSENVPVVVYSDLPDERFTCSFVSGRVEELTGYPSEEFLEKPEMWMQIVHPEDRAHLRQKAQEFREKRVPLDEQYRIVTRDDVVKWIRDTAVPVVGDGDEITRIDGFMEDITRRKEAESQRDAWLQALRESDRKLRLIAENTTDVIYAYDMDRRLFYVNPALETLTGYSVEELQERDFINWLHPDDEARIARLWGELFEGRNPFEEEFRIVTRDGQVKWVEGIWVPLYDENGQQIGIQGHDRDITERKQAEQELIRSERLAALGQLAASLAHEINNPLQIIQNHLDLVLDFPIEAAQRQECYQVIRHEIERLSGITTSMLDLAHPRPGTVQVADAVEAVQHVLRLASKRIEQRRIEVTTDLNPVPPVLCMPENLAAVFLNLVVNGGEAMPDTDSGRLHIAVGETEGQVIVSFTNNGPAIPDHVLPHIFEPFYTTKPDGNGLGLWVSHRLLQSAGSLTVRNLEDGQGVVFDVRLDTEPSLTAGKG